ncbi:uncharacterized protein TRAVEDRAFT_22708 [Trametes versicolor FP-101664 SS1]|uniref:uncharacterized protein n=1 Tax=Trametes versicolor (strain FP-101664) TaxID=717944 RepID=UPI0004621762|nr:uncharacterized protein TRAVEDRAFT_22708 [Trametes versicolor FP-101664 SS1]EIW54838.1 hypothetical protein TRAVEDRAFT_22708 [Trametes versicolor FP-101664 SS1]
MASLIATYARRRQMSRDLVLNSTFTPLHQSDNHNGPGSGHGNGENLDTEGSHGGSDNGQSGSNGDKNSGDSGDDSKSGDGSNGNSQGGSSSSQNGQHGNAGGGNDSGQGGSPGQNSNNCGAAMNPLMPDPRLCTGVNENDGRLKYGTGWVLASRDPNGKSLTSHSTMVNGSSVVVDFSGTSIVVFGTVPPSNMSEIPPSASYSIDGRRAFELSLPASDRCIPNQQFFQSPMLSPGTHNLTINVTTAGTPYILDYLWFCGSSVPSADSSGTSPKTAHGGFSRVDAIVVGSVVGGVIFLLGIASLVWFFLRRRRRRRRLRKLKIAASPVSSWLHSQNNSGSGTEIVFTSTESIMRDNPTCSSTADSKEHQRKALELSMPITTTFHEQPPGLTSSTVVDHIPEGYTSLAPPPWIVRPLSTAS